jgi:hypothetical protein
MKQTTVEMLLFNPPDKYAIKFPCINAFRAKPPKSSWATALCADASFDRLLLPCPRPATAKECERRIHDVEEEEEEICLEEIEKPTRNPFEFKFLVTKKPKFEIYVPKKIKIEVFSEKPVKKEVKRRKSSPQSQNGRRRLSKQAPVIAEEEEKVFNLFDTLDERTPTPPDLKGLQTSLCWISIIS